MKTIFITMALYLTCSLYAEEELIRLDNPETYTKMSVGFRSNSARKLVVYQYKTYLSFLKEDSTYTYYEFDGTNYTEFTADGNLPTSDYTVAGSGVESIYLKADDPSLLYLRIIDNSLKASFYQWDGTTLSLLSSPQDLDESGITYGYVGELNNSSYFATDDNVGTSLLLKKVGTSLVKVENPAEATKVNSETVVGVRGFLAVNDVDNLAYVGMVTDDGVNHLALFDGESFTYIKPENHDTLKTIKSIDDRTIGAVFKNASGVNEPFIYDAASNEFHAITGHTPTLISGQGAIHGITVLDGILYYGYGSGSKENEMYKVDLSTFTATEVSDMTPDEHYLSGFNVVSRTINNNTEIVYRIRKLSNNAFDLAHYDGTTTTLIPAPTGYDGQNARGVFTLSTFDKAGNDKIYVRLRADRYNTDFPNSSGQLYVYSTTNKTMTGPITVPETDTDVVSWGYNSFSFSLGNDVFHIYRDDNKNNVFYKEENVCIEQINPNPIAVSVTAPSYTVPSGNYSVTTDGTYKDTIMTQAGCDSIITLQISFISPPVVTDLSIVDSPTDDGVEITDSTYNQGETIYVKVSYSDNIVASNALNSNPTIQITSTGKDLVYHSYYENSLYFAYTVSEDEKVFTVMTLADEITLNNGEILNDNLDNNASLDISSVNNLGGNILTDSKDAIILLQEAISPNPFSNEININLPFSENISVMLTDLNGKIILQAQNTESIATEELAKGMYLLHITDGSNHKAYVKLIKE